MRAQRVCFDPNDSNQRDNGTYSAVHPSSVSPTSTRTRTFRSMNVTKGKLESTAMSSTESNERTELLKASPSHANEIYGTTNSPLSRSRAVSKKNSYSSLRTYQSHLRKPSGTDHTFDPAFPRSGLRTPRLHRSLILENSATDDRAWYDQFTSTDWVHDSIADGHRLLELKKRKDFRGRLRLIFDAAQGWIIVALIGCLTALVAYVIDVTEAAVFDLKRGYCTKGWYLSLNTCCNSREVCSDWHTWSRIIHPSRPDSILGDYLGFTVGCVTFALIACGLTLLSKTVIPAHIASTFDENLGADRRKTVEDSFDTRPASENSTSKIRPAMTYYAAAGSGVAEVKVILSGFVLHGYLGLKTFLLKCPALVFSVASGMSLGKEGPYVHIATCIGNIACRFFPKYNLNDGKRREVLSAAAASGVAVAFGSPLGGVLFSLEEVSYYFPPKTLFRTFFCCIVAALSLKFLNPYGTSKIVLFEVRYVTDWQVFELMSFAFLGVAGGLAGALFIKVSHFWARTFRKSKMIKSYPWFEVFLVALITGLVSFWNRCANLPVAEFMLELASPCGDKNVTGLCPQTREEIPQTIRYLFGAFVIKACLTIVTFGTKVPAGIYVPSMVCGGLMGRIFGHTIQYAILSAPESSYFGHCSASSNAEHCITPGVYALVAAGATMCGVTRLSVTLAVILFELTGSLDYVLPFAIGVLIAKWTADFVEPHSIYDLLIEMNSYPFIDNRQTPLFDQHTELSDITPRFRGERIIDISISPYVKASELRIKLTLLQDAGELDGGLPILREKAIVGFIPAPDLEFALDSIESPEDQTLCLMSHNDRFTHVIESNRWLESPDGDNESREFVRSSASSITSTGLPEEASMHEVDFVSYIDPAPMRLDAHSPLNLVFQCFSKLGLRYICVEESGEYQGMVHKKLFVKYLKTCEAKHA